MFFTTYLRLIFGLDVPFLRSLFVFCSFFVRSLFVHCSFIVRSLFVFCSSFVRLLFVLCSFFVRLFSICLCGSHYLPILLGLPVWLTPLTLHFSLNCFPILIKILHRDFFPIKANIFKLFCYLTTFAYNDDSEVF